MRSDGTHILTGATWFHRWYAARATASWTSMDLSLEYQLRIQAWLHLPTEATALPPVWLSSSIVTRSCDRPTGARECVFGLSGVTSRWSGRHGTFDLTGEVRFAQWRESHSDRSDSVSPMVFVNGDGSLDIDGLEFGVSAVFSSLASFWLSSLIVTRRCDLLFGACQCLWRCWRDFAFERK